MCPMAEAGWRGLQNCVYHFGGGIFSRSGVDGRAQEPRHGFGVRPYLMEGYPMDWNRVEGNWKEVKGKVKEKWAKLTDDDLTEINGRRDQLEGRLQARYGY